MKRIPQLDGIRGIAILLVLVWHYVSCQISAGHGDFVHYFRKCLSLTWSGVDLFFVLSGFLIAGILLDNREASNYFRVFYLRRMCRIFPLYFLLLALYIGFSSLPFFSGPAFSWLFGQPLPVWSYATFTQNILMGIRGNYGPHWLGITWSLAVEEQFYLFMPLLVYLFRRQRVLMVFLFLLMLAPLLRLSFPGFHVFVNTPWRADSLLAGACVAIMIRSRSFDALVATHRQRLNVLFVVLLAGAVMMSLGYAPMGTLRHVWLAGLYSMLVLLAVADVNDHVSSLLKNRMLVGLGTISYGIYMFHEAVSGLVHGLLRGTAPAMRSAADAGITALALLITLVLAALSYRYFEKPFLQFGHRFQYLGSTSDDRVLLALSDRKVGA